MDILLQFLDVVLHLDVHLAEWGQAYGAWIYLILFLVVFCETGLVVTPFLPGDSLLFAAGALAATGGTDIGVTMAVLLIAAVSGDNVNYMVGRLIGKRVFAWDKSRFFNKDGFEKTHAYFEKYGAKTLIIARFIVLVRTFAPFTAGVGRMSYFKFLSISSLGGMLWVGSLCLAGFWLGNIPVVKRNIEFVILGIIFASLVPVAWAFVQHKILKK